MEKPLYPSPYMRITQGYMMGTHADSYAIDDAGSDSGIDFIVAPFTGVIRKIYTSDANEVWLESSEPVIYPDGTVDYMTMMFAHWSINNGKNPTECLWIDDSITVLNSYGYTFKRIEPEVVVPDTPSDDVPIEDDTPIVEEPVKEEPTDIDDADNSDTTNTDTSAMVVKPKLIFTCKSDDIYAIELKAGQKLLVSSLP